MKKRWVSLLTVPLAAACYGSYLLVQPTSASGTTEFLIHPQTKPQPLKSTQFKLRRGAIGYFDPNTNTPVCRNIGDPKTELTPEATASLAKTITVQVVLAHKPLVAGQEGPTITLTSADVDRYSYAVRNGGSRVQIVAGEQLTERQMIQGIMLRSANNLADSLAVWAFGSHAAYQQAATAWLKQHNINHTTVGLDASGFDPSTTSTPEDLCKIILFAANHPALRDILANPTANLPVVGQIHTTNKLLGQHNVFAGKTGFNNEAGHGVILARQLQLDDVTLTGAAVALSQSNYNAAFDAAGQLLDTLPQDIRALHIRQGELAGRINDAAGNHAIVASQALTIPYFSDQPPQLITNRNFQTVRPLSSQAVVGHLKVNQSQIDLLVQ